MNKTELTLAAIFRHCDEVEEGKRPPRNEKEGTEAALAWLGGEGAAWIRHERRMTPLVRLTRPARCPASKLFSDELPFMNSTFLANLHHAYAQTDGTYKFPNSREGDMLKTAKREIEALLRMVKTPCGKCHFQPGETCYICGAKDNDKVQGTAD